MNNIKSFKQFFLLEGKTDIKTKWLPDTNFHNLLTKDDDNLLNRLINLDPTSILESDKIGKYVSWLIILYRRGDATLKQVLSYDNMEDDYKISEALEFFDKNKNLFDKKDINQYKTLDELFTKIKSFDEMSSNIVQKTEKYKYYTDLDKSGRITKFYENNNWLIIIPNDEEISCDIAGTKTSWCTARPTGSHFNTYNKDGKLYIFLDKKKNLYPTYQLHIEKPEFQDNKSKNIKPVEFFENNLDIFNKIFPNLVDKLNNKESLNKKERHWLPQSLLNSYKERFLGDDNSLYSIFNKINNGDLSMEEVITKELLGFPFEYELEFDEYKKEIDISSKDISGDLEDAFSIENGVLNDIDTWGSSNYHYSYGGGGNFDRDEYNYMFNYLNDETVERLNYLKKLLQYKKSIEVEGELHTFLSEYKLDDILETYEYEYENMVDSAKHEEAKSIVDTWCFYFNGNSASFRVDDIVTLLEKNIETEHTTLFEVLEESNILDLSYEWEYDTHNNQDVTQLNSEMLSSIEKVIDSIEDGDSEYANVKYISSIYDKLSSIGFVENDENNQFYENDKISLEIKSLKISEETEEDDTEEDIINECKLEIVYIDKTTEKKLKGYIKFKNISKYLQPMLF